MRNEEPGTMKGRRSDAPRPSVGYDPDGSLDIFHECCGEQACAYRMCEMEPPEEGMECVCKRYGSTCYSLPARIAGIEKLIRNLKKEIKQIEEEFDA